MLSALIQINNGTAGSLDCCIGHIQQMFCLAFTFFSCNNLNHTYLLLELYMLYKKSIKIILIIVQIHAERNHYWKLYLSYYHKDEDGCLISEQRI